MKINPKKAMMIGLASSMLFTAAGCKDKASTDATTASATVEQNSPAVVYGPPEFFTEEDVTTEEATETTEAPSVNQNKNEDVYGPPEDMP